MGFQDYTLKNWEQVTELLKQSEHLYQEMLMLEMEKSKWLVS